jgi:hypothetical protein
MVEQNPKIVQRAPVDHGATHLEFRVGKPKPKDKAFLDQVAPKFAEDLPKAIVTLRQIVEQQQPCTAVIDEPLLPPSNERFLTEPVK